MKLADLFLNRFLYRDNNQNSETKDASFVSADSSSAEPSPIPSGGAAQDINSGNVLIDGGQLEPGTFPTTVLDVSNWGWGQTCAFSSTNLNTVSWGAGTFTSADGSSYSISAGNTGAMAGKTYIYLSLLDSETAYQITTTPSEAVGIGKVLVAVANPDTTSATYNLSEATQIVGDNILANSINASKITTGQLIVGTNVGLGTAEDSAGVTTIIGNTVDTGYITALGLSVGSGVGIGTAFASADAGDLAYLDLVSAAKLDSTVIVGGYIKTNLLTASNIITGTLNASLVTVSNLVVGGNVGQGTAARTFNSEPTTPYYVGDLWSGGSTGDLKRCITQRLTGAYNAADWDLASKYTDNTALNTLINDLGDVAYLDLVSAAKLDSTVIVGGYIKTSLLTADNIQAGTLTTKSGNTGVKVEAGGDIVFESETYSSFSQLKFTEKGVSNTGWDIEFTPTGGGGYNAGAMNFMPQSSNTYKTVWFGKDIGPTANVIITGSLDVDSTLTAKAITSRTITPETDSTYDLGSSSVLWRYIYGDRFYVDSSRYIYVSSNRITSSSDFVANGSLHATGNLYTGAVNGESGSVNCALVNTAKVNLRYAATNPSSAGDIVNYVSGTTDQFRGIPGDGTWAGSFDMTAY